jgi:hypothetical protein
MFFHVLFYSALHFCNSQLGPQSRITAFESLTILLEKVDITIEASNIQALTAINMVDEGVLGSLMSCVWDHWDDPVETISYKVGAACRSILSRVSIAYLCSIAIRSN